jgi:hypothetical protein
VTENNVQLTGQEIETVMDWLGRSPTYDNIARKAYAKLERALAEIKRQERRDTGEATPF